MDRPRENHRHCPYLAQHHDSYLGHGHDRGRADVGYLLFVDLKGHMSFFPGTVMTLISATAILLSFWASLPARKSAKAA